MSDLVYVQDGEIHEKAINGSVGDFSADGGVLGFMNYTVSNSQFLPGWWQHRRERVLQKAAVENDLISMALWNLQMLLESLPFAVRPRNTMIDAHFRIAEFYDTVIRDAWHKIGSKMILDMLVHDMGAYAVIESNSSWSQPLKRDSGIPTGLTHLPTSRIIINNKDSDRFPIIYVHKEKGNIKIHHSRLIQMTQLPFGIHEESQVGLSFVSRAFNVAEVMRSVNVHALEQLGELDAQRIVWGTDTTGKEIKRAFTDAQREASQFGKNRAGGNVYIGMRNSSAKIGMLDIKRLPPGFDWSSFTQTTLRLLAFAAGVDVNDLLATDTAGTGKSSVAIADLKSKQKLYTWFCNTLKRELESKVLPADLEFVIGTANNDISEGKARTFTSLSRANKFSLDSGTIDERTSREIQLRHGMLTQEQMFFMELEEGRLPDGLPVSAVFFKNEQGLQKFLGLSGFTEPWLIEEHDAEEIIPVIQRKIFELQGEVINAESRTRHKNARIALAAFGWLLMEYETMKAKQLLEEQMSQASETPQDDAEEDVNDDVVEEDENVQKGSYRGKKRRKKKKKKKHKEEVFSTTTKVGREANKRMKSHVRNAFTTKELDLDTLGNELREILIEWDVLDESVDDVVEDFLDIATSLEFNDVVRNKKLTHVLDTYQEIIDELDF